MCKLLEGEVCVMTGGGQGVGLGIAQEFVEPLREVGSSIGAQRGRRFCPSPSSSEFPTVPGCTETSCLCT
jgi:hypothetical protein